MIALGDLNQLPPVFGKPYFLKNPDSEKNKSKKHNYSNYAYGALGVCAVIGFIIGQVRMPESRAFDLFRKTGGEYIKNVITNYFKFQKTKKYYIYDPEAKINPVKDTKRK